MAVSAWRWVMGGSAWQWAYGGLGCFQWVVSGAQDPMGAGGCPNIKTRSRSSSSPPWPVKSPWGLAQNFRAGCNTREHIFRGISKDRGDPDCSRGQVHKTIWPRPRDQRGVLKIPCFIPLFTTHFQSVKGCSYGKDRENLFGEFMGRYPLYGTSPRKYLEVQVKSCFRPCPLKSKARRYMLARKETCGNA